MPQVSDQWLDHKLLLCPMEFTCMLTAGLMNPHGRIHAAGLKWADASCYGLEPEQCTGLNDLMLLQLLMSRVRCQQQFAMDS